MSYKIFNLKFKGKRRNKLDLMTRLSKVIYDPFRGIDSEWEERLEEQSVYCLNSFVPPVWYTRNYSTEEVTNLKEIYPPFFISFLKWLFPLPAHQSIVLDWISLALFSRPESMLLLRGARGNGTTFFKHLLFHLIGSFYEVLPDVSLDYNADLRHKRIIGLDDNKMIGSHKGELLRKSITNPIMSYQEKFVQTTVSEEQYASFVICSNPADPFVVHHDERKIVSPLLSEIKMQAWTTPRHFAWLKAFEKTEVRSAPHIAFLRQIGEALLARFSRRNPPINLELKAGHFWADVSRSLPSFRRYILGQLLHGDREKGVNYELEKEEYALSHKGFGGKVDQWPSLKHWATKDMSWYGHQLLAHVDDRKKVLYANPEIDVRKYPIS